MWSLAQGWSALLADRARRSHAPAGRRSPISISCHLRLEGPFASLGPGAAVGRRPGAEAVPRAGVPPPVVAAPGVCSASRLPEAAGRSAVAAGCLAVVAVVVAVVGSAAVVGDPVVAAVAAPVPEVHSAAQLPEAGAAVLPAAAEAATLLAVAVAAGRPAV